MQKILIGTSRPLSLSSQSVKLCAHVRTPIYTLSQLYYLIYDIFCLAMQVMW